MFSIISMDNYSITHPMYTNQLPTIMNATKKSLKKFVDKEQKRVIMVTVGEDGKLQIKGDHISF